MNRRELLRLGLLAFAGGALGCAPPEDVAGIDLGPPSPGCDVDAGDPWEAARRLGARLLADGGVTEAEASTLPDELPDAPDAEAGLAELRLRHADDLDADDVVTVDGWLLSRTEARFYAWVALG